MTTKTLVSWVLTAGPLFILPSVPVYASHLSDTNSVSIDTVTVSACGSQSLTFSGRGTYSEPTQHLVVTLDGTEIFDGHDEPDPWTTGSVTVAPGTHTLTAVIYDRFTHEDVEATSSVTFTVGACGTSEGGGGGGGGTPASSSGGGSSTDCCPGPDKVQSKKKPAAKGRVKAAAVKRMPKTLPLRVKPVNELFRKVHGRSPISTEWEYWARRSLSDKPQYDALYGAIQWHRLLGHTTGGPNPILIAPSKMRVK